MSKKPKCTFDKWMKDPEIKKSYKKEKPVRKLKDLPKHMRTRKWIDGCIRYEGATGVHTYHQCDCNRGMCRSIMCAECWRELLKRKKK